MHICSYINLPSIPWNANGCIDSMIFLSKSKEFKILSDIKALGGSCWTLLLARSNTSSDSPPIAANSSGRSATILFSCSWSLWRELRSLRGLDGTAVNLFAPRLSLVRLRPTPTKARLSMNFILFPYKDRRRRECRP